MWSPSHMLSVTSRQQHLGDPCHCGNPVETGGRTALALPTLRRLFPPSPQLHGGLGMGAVGGAGCPAREAPPLGGSLVQRTLWGRLRSSLAQEQQPDALGLAPWKASPLAISKPRYPARPSLPSASFPSGMHTPPYFPHPPGASPQSS